MYRKIRCNEEFYFFFVFGWTKQGLISWVTWILLLFTCTVCLPDQRPPATGLRTYYRSMRSNLSCVFFSVPVSMQESIYLWVSACLSVLSCHCINPDLDTAARRSPWLLAGPGPCMLFHSHTSCLSSLDLVTLLASSAMFSKRSHVLLPARLFQPALTCPMTF